MTPIRVTFKSGHFITAWSTDPDSFARSVADVQPPEITNIEYVRAVSDTVPELQEMTINLKSGSTLMCEIPKAELSKLRWVDEIENFQQSTTIAYARMAQEEAELDARFTAASSVINNLPHLPTRLHVHKQYLKRKAAYIAAVEALVDSVIKRPDK